LSLAAAPNRLEGTLAGRAGVCDRGTREPEKNPIESRRRSRLKFRLDGKKLPGGWSLVRMNGKRGGKNWLLIKERAEEAASADLERPRRASVKSGRTGAEAAARPGGKKAALADFYSPELATLVDRVPSGNEWLHEIKFDGYRILARIDRGRVKLFTREAHDWTARFENCAAALAQLPVRQAFLDGEIAALREDGSSDFQLLQNSLRAGAPARIVYFIFDLLYLDGADLRAAPLQKRKQALQKILEGAPENLRYSEHWIGRGAALYEKAGAAGLEGIVSKRIDRPYRAGRGRDWLKIKCVRSQEFVIAGFTDPAGARAHFGALVLGVYGADGKLRYAGRVGTGFSAASLRELGARMNKLRASESPLAEPLPRRQSRAVHWIAPELVCEVAFTGWTEDQLLRHPSFKGLREDKPPAEVRRETETPLARARASADRIEIAGIELTHADRILYPEQGLTKLDLARYYEKIAARMLPHLADRPLTLLRCPEGYGAACFYQRHSKEKLDPAIRPVRIKENKSGAAYLAVDSLAGLIALAQMSVLEIHTWQARAGDLERPDQLIFDLDPDPALGWKEIKDAALDWRARLRAAGLTAFVKTTGGKGLHLVVPLAPKRDWEFVKDFARAVAQSAARDAPKRYTATPAKAKREGKIFIDYLRNAKTASAVCAYSPRARAGAPVSMPLRWEDLKTDPRGKFSIETAPERVARSRRDPWADFEPARVALEPGMLKQF